MAERLGDLIEVPEVKLVVELDDADKDPAGIAASFILTKEVEDGLKILLGRINDEKGCGAFIKGNFGSGKSHFLSYLYLLLKDRTAPILNDYPKIREIPIRAAKISLVKYPASLSLEKIILDSLGFKGEVVNRDEQFREILDSPTIVIIDELSEFLRSKQTPSAFYEDLRFLQFLGEFSFHNPLWIVASLQEWIEETGHISSSIFNRIKDRYPLRINLSSSHIEDIIDQRIVIKKEGAEEVIKDVFADLKRFYPHLNFKYEDFRKTYPLHPFATRYVAGLTSIFSQRRGVIHFVSSEARKILDAAPDTLITPEAIFDHFEERIREAPEYSPLVRVVYDYYKRHIDEILAQPLQKEIGLSVIKILILTEISPFEKKKTAKEIAEILLKKISDITSKINYDYIKKAVLEPLVARQMYIKKDGEAYIIDTAVDEGLRIKAKIKAVRERFEDRNYLFTELCNLTSAPYLPLRDVKEGKKYRFQWQNSMRECVALTFLSPQITKEEIERFLAGIEKKVDGFFIILSPFLPADWVQTIKDTNPSRFLSSMICWIPRPFTDDEELFVEEYAAKSILLKDFPDLSSDLRRNETEFRDLITRAYFEGKIAYASGKVIDNLKDIGYLPLERLLAHLFDHSLTELHPDHCRIMPRGDYFSSLHLNTLYNSFIRLGRITIEEAEKRGLTSYINGLLEPLGLISKRGGSFLISLDAENEIISHILNISSRDVHLTDLRTTLKKGRWGMTDEQINLTLSALIASGHLIPCSRDEIIELRELQQLSGEVTRVRPGKTLHPDVLSYIPCGKFIWGEVESVPTPLTQKMMWKEAAGFVRKERKLLEEVQNFINRYSEYSILRQMQIEFALLNRLSMFLNSVTFSMPPADGIERFLSYFKESPDMGDEAAYLEKLHTFFSEQFQLMNKYHLYLTHQSLKTGGDLEEKRRILLSEMEEFLRAFKGDFISIRERWGEFFEAFTKTYKERHDLYYQSDIFRTRKEIEDSHEAKALKRIARVVMSVNFQGEWWDLKRELDRFPDPCREDLNYELFLNPVCKCGFTIGSDPPEIHLNSPEMSRAGICNFLRVLKSHENKEKIDSYILGLKDAGREDASKRDLAKRLSSLISLDSEKTALPMILPLLTDDILHEIENALKGRWKTREIRITDFVNMIRGRRFKHGELKKLFLKWAGDDEESIIHVKGEDHPENMAIKEELSKYGSQGEMIFREIEGDITSGSLERLEEELRERGGTQALDSLNWTSYSTDDLFGFLKKEKIAYLKKRIRGEIFHRSWGKIIREPVMNAVDDAVMRDLLRMISLISEAGKLRGVEVFTRLIAPLVFLSEKASHENISEVNIDREILEKIREKIEGIVRDYENSPDRFDGAKDIAYVKEYLKGTVVIFDGLRYDLWYMLREMMEKEGWKLKEETFRVLPPSTTPDFRKALGISEGGKGYLNGRSYALWKWTERDTGKRDLKRFLKTAEDIKFLHFNFIDTKVHGSTLDLYPLYMTIKGEFAHGIIPVLREIHSCYLLPDHGFTDTRRLKERYTHGRGSIWETILPFVEVIGG